MLLLCFSCIACNINAMITNTMYRIIVVFPKSNPQIVAMLKGTEITGAAPNPTFVFNVSPNARSTSPNTYNTTRYILALFNHCTPYNR